MSDNPLSGRVGLDTTDFKTAVSEMNRDIRVIESGFRASAASLGDWSASATGLEMRIRALTGEIGLQQQKVEALRAEYERVKAEKGANSRAAEELEIKLNRETETLGKMESELGTTQAALAEMGGESATTGGQVDDLQQEEEEATTSTFNLSGSLDALKTGLKLAVLAVAAMATAVVGLGIGIGKLVLDTAKQAGELADLSVKTGISTERLQEMQYIADQVGTSTDTMTGAMAKLTRSMGTAQDSWEKVAEAQANWEEGDPEPLLNDTAAAFNQLGVSLTDSEGQLRDQEVVFADVLTALGTMEEGTERDALAMQIFGKSAQELNPLISAGADKLDQLARQAHRVGAVMSGENVAAMADFDDQIASLEAGFKGMIGTLAVMFLPLAKDVFAAFEVLGKIVQEFLGYLQTGDISDFYGILYDTFGPETAGQISGFVEGAAAWITGTLIPTLREIGTWLQVNLPIALQTLSNLWTGTLQPALGQIVTFIQANATPILAGLAAALLLVVVPAFIAWAAGAAAAAIATIAAIAPIAIPVLAIAAAVALLAAAWENDWGGIRTTLTAVWETNLKPIFDQVVAWLQVNIPAAIKILSDFWTGTLLPAIQGAWSWMSTTLFPFLGALADVVGAVLGKAVEALAGLWQNVLQPALEAAGKYLSETFGPIFEDLGDIIEDPVMPVLTVLADLIGVQLKKAFDDISKAIQAATDWLSGLAEGIKNVQLPDWLTPGSPTPFELGLRGISAALEDLARTKLPEFSAQVNMSAALPAAGGPGMAPVATAAGPITIHIYSSDPHAAGRSVIGALRAEGRA